MISRKIIFPRFMDVEWRDHIRELIPIRHLSNWNSRALLVLIELTNEELVILLADSTSDSIFLLLARCFPSLLIQPRLDLELFRRYLSTYALRAHSSVTVPTRCLKRVYPKGLSAGLDCYRSNHPFRSAFEIGKLWHR